MNHRGTEGTEWVKQDLNGLSQRVIGACMEVHRTLGPGLLESAYEMALAHELTLGGRAFERQRPMPLKYKGILLDCGYRIDFVVEGKLIVEIKAVAEVLPNPPRATAYVSQARTEAARAADQF